MDYETHDTLSLVVVATVAILAVTLMVLELAPGTGHQGTIKNGDIAKNTLSEQSRIGLAVDPNQCVPIPHQFDYTSLDFNEDGTLNYYDYQDVLEGRVDCAKKDCDLNDDGLIDERDRKSFNLLVTKLYDYDNDQQLTRKDSLFLRDVLAGVATCTSNHICDLNGDGKLCANDIVLSTSLIYNYDNPEVRKE